MNKFLYAVGLLGTMSHAAEAAAHEGALSPQGHHGGKNGGMCGTAFRHCDEAATLIITVRQLDETRGVIGKPRDFPISSNMTVPDFKAILMEALRIPAAHRIMWNGVEVMRENVDAERALITLASIFNGVSGILTIDVIVDHGRSPMLTPVPGLSGDVSPLKVDESD